MNKVNFTVQFNRFLSAYRKHAATFNFRLGTLREYNRFVQSCHQNHGKIYSSGLILKILLKNFENQITLYIFH